MRKKIISAILAVLCVCTVLTPVPLAAADTTADWINFDLSTPDALTYFTDASNLTCSFNTSEQAIQLSTTGGSDPHITLNLQGMKIASATNYKYLAVTYRCPVTNSATAGYAQFYVMTANQPFSEVKSFKSKLQNSYTYQTIVYNLSGQTYWNGQINKIRIDPFSRGDTAWDTMYLQSVAVFADYTEAKEAAADLTADANGYLAGIEDIETKAAETGYDLEMSSAPIWEGNIVYRESALPLLNPDGSMSPISLMYDIDRVVTVRNALYDTEYKYGRDYEVVDGKLVIKTPAQGGTIPLVNYSTIYSSTALNEKYFYSSELGCYVFVSDPDDYHRMQIVITYTHADSWDGYVPKSATTTLQRTVSKLDGNQDTTIVFCGDSITYGCNSSEFLELPPYSHKWAKIACEALGAAYGNSKIHYVNTAVCATKSDWGYANVNTNIIQYNPDLAVLAFGINDISTGVPTATFKANTKGMIEAIQASCPNCDIILVAPMVLNPEIQGAMAPTFTAYLNAMYELSDDYEGVAVVDMTSMHRSLLTMRRNIDITGNNYNHTNDFLSGVYAQSIVAALTGTEITEPVELVTHVSTDSIRAADGTTALTGFTIDPLGTNIGTTQEDTIYAYGWMASSLRIRKFGYRYGDQVVINSEKAPTEPAVTQAGLPYAGTTGTVSRFNIAIPLDENKHEVYAVAELYDGTVIDIGKITYTKEAPVFTLRTKVSADQVLAGDGVTNLASVGGNSPSGTALGTVNTNSIILYGWFAASLPIVKFGYRYGSQSTLNSNLYTTEQAVINAGASYAGTTGSTSRFRITVPLDTSASEVYAVAQLSDGTVVDMWKITYSVLQAELHKKSFNTIILDSQTLCDTADAAAWCTAHPISFYQGDHSTMMLKGWAYCNMTIKGFGYRIDGGQTQTGNFIDPRTDIHTSVNPNAVGYKINADISALGVGTHTVQIIVITSNNAELVVDSMSITVKKIDTSARMLDHSVDYIKLGTNVLSNGSTNCHAYLANNVITVAAKSCPIFVFRGWAYLNTKIVGFGYRIDGGDVIRGRFGESRPDAKSVINENAEGFFVYADIEDLAPGTHTLEAVAIAADGTPVTICTATLNVTPSALSTRDAMPDTWVATDALGRTLPTNAETGGPRTDKTLALFYWTWHEGKNLDNTPVNLNDLMARYPAAQNDASHYAWSTAPNTTTFHWNEPLYGFYSTLDKWVLRRHAELLATSGVDVIFFDNTNGAYTWTDSYLTLCSVFEEARAQGVETPKIAFLLPFSDHSGNYEQLRSIFSTLYKPGRYQDLWFYWEGKPLIMAFNTSVRASSDALDKEIAAFFTFKTPEPLYNTERSITNNRWTWLSNYPQAVTYRADGSAEHMTVSVAQNWSFSLNQLCAMNGVNIQGRTWTSHGYDTRPNAKLYGANFNEQIEYALDVDPDFVFITGWNEWIAGRQLPDWLGTPNAFPDEFTDALSRDIEPTKGELGDNYYYQMVDFIRRYKGTRAVPAASAAKTININAATDQWSDVAPEYIAYQGNTFNRNATGYGGIRYTDTSGRNDIVSAKVARDSNNLYFMCECASDITAYQANTGWMRLYIDVEGRTGAQWNTFDFIVEPQGNGIAYVKVCSADNQWQWTKVGEVSYTVSGKRIQISIPRSMLGLTGSTFTVNFKWSDNTCLTGNIMDFYVTGDVAPGARYKYQYNVK